MIRNVNGEVRGFSNTSVIIKIKDNGKITAMLCMMIMLYSIKTNG